MAESISTDEVKVRIKLEEIQNAWGNQKLFNIDQLTHVLKNPVKYSDNRQVELISKTFKNYITNFDEIIKQFELDKAKNKKTPYEAFVKLIINAKFIRKLPVKNPQIIVEQTGSDIESPTLSSTRVERRKSDAMVLEIKEKLAQATNQANVPQSARRHTVSVSPANIGKSSLKTAQNNANQMKTSSKSLFTFKNGASISSVWNFALDDKTAKILSELENKNSFVGLPLSQQERVVISELLSTLIGLNGSLIVPKQKTIPYEIDDLNQNHCSNIQISIIEFEIDNKIQDSIRDILQDILPLANLYYQIQNFVEYSSSSKSGQVLQALSWAVSKLITEYYSMIAQLERLHIKNELNLQKIIVYLRPIMKTMETIAKTCNMLMVQNIRGGNVLTSLHENVALYSGDINSQKVLRFLTEKAAEPYMEILKLWLFKGVIIDRNDEFFVEDNVGECMNPEENENYFDQYWDKRYLLKFEKVPKFLEKQADMISKTGKYLNVVREFGNRVKFNHDQDLKFSLIDGQNYVNIINDAFFYASKTLLELIVNDCDLMGHLSSIKRYFLLHQGDFIVQFMDACETEMMKTVDEIIPTRLENLLELTLRLSSAKDDKYQDNLFTQLFNFDISSQISKICQSSDDIDADSFDYSNRCIEYFAFGYNVQWPLSIVLNQISMSKYQLVFRQLYYCKFVENFLCGVWIENKKVKKYNLKVSDKYRAAFTLRQRMLTAMQNLEYYMMVEVIEPIWHDFIDKIGKAKNIDDVLYLHEDFLDHCLKNCMLTHPEPLKRIVTVLKDCVSFCEFIRNPKSFQSDDTKNSTFSEIVEMFDTTFTKNVIKLLESVYEVAARENTEKFISLCNRLNFNNYYSGYLNGN